MSKGHAWTFDRLSGALKLVQKHQKKDFHERFYTVYIIMFYELELNQFKYPGESPGLYQLPTFQTRSKYKDENVFTLTLRNIVGKNFELKICWFSDH